MRRVPSSRTPALEVDRQLDNTAYDNVKIVAGNIGSVVIAATNIADIATVSNMVADITEVANALPIIDDVTPSLVKTYSSNKIQSMYDSQVEAISNLASVSGSLVDDGTDLSLTTVMQNLTFTPVINTSNILLLDILEDEIEIKTNGVFNFFSTITLKLNTTGTRVVTFEVYDKNTPTTVYATAIGTINGANNDIIPIQVNTLMSISTVPFDGSIFVKVRAKLDTGNGSLVVQRFNSVLVLSGAVGGGGGQYLGKAPIKSLGYLGYVSAEELILAPGSNGYSIDSLTIESGGSLTIPNNSVYKVL